MTNLSQPSISIMVFKDSSDEFDGDGEPKLRIGDLGGVDSWGEVIFGMVKGFEGLIRICGGWEVLRGKLIPGTGDVGSGICLSSGWEELRIYDQSDQYRVELVQVMVV